MKIGLRLIVLGVLLSFANLAFGQIVSQTPGTDYLIVEAEAFADDEFNDAFVGFTVLDPANPREFDLDDQIEVDGFLSLPPANTNMSGTAIFDQKGKVALRSSLIYEMQFEEAGDYFLYVRYSLYDMRKLVDDAYGNENSFFIPVESIDQDPLDEVIQESRDGVATLTNDIDGVPYPPSAGCRIDTEPWLLPDAECAAEDLRGDEQFEGQYHWQPVLFGNGLGHAQYEIDVTGKPVDFTIATRERGASIDAFIFSKNQDLFPDELDQILFGGGGDPCDFDGDGSIGASDIDLLMSQIRVGSTDMTYDVNQDGMVSSEDTTFLVGDASKLNTYFGDSNLDGEFNSGDFVQVFQAGLFETTNDATWSQGDWNGDAQFNSGDFVLAFQDGGFEIGPKATAVAVPEPASIGLLLIGLAAIAVRRR